MRGTAASDFNLAGGQPVSAASPQSWRRDRLVTDSDNVRLDRIISLVRGDPRCDDALVKGADSSV
eukprot:m.429448 g.429448  ORF g.429448 m.429448 type:complete len:65 (+) comp17004_c0_seq1:4261-4455(+)